MTRGRRRTVVRVLVAALLWFVAATPLPGESQRLGPLPLQLPVGSEMAFSTRGRMDILGSLSGVYLLGTRMEASPDYGPVVFCSLAVENTVAKLLVWRTPCISVSLASLPTPRRVNFSRTYSRAASASCVLNFTADGKVQLRLALPGTAVQSSALLFSGNTSGNAVRHAVLDDAGDLVLRTADMSTVWKSSDYYRSPHPPSGCVHGHRASRSAAHIFSMNSTKSPPTELPDHVVGSRAVSLIQATSSFSSSATIHEIGLKRSVAKRGTGTPRDAINPKRTSAGVSSSTRKKTKKRVVQSKKPAGESGFLMGSAVADLLLSSVSVPLLS